MTRYRYLTAYWKNPIQENKADNPPNDFGCLWRRHRKSHGWALCEASAA